MRLVLPMVPCVFVCGQLADWQTQTDPRLIGASPTDWCVPQHRELRAKKEELHELREMRAAKQEERRKRQQEVDAAWGE